MITVVQGSPQSLWVPVALSTTAYVGSICCRDSSSLADGVKVLPTAVGASNTTNKDVPFGVIRGTNRRDPAYSSTYLTNYITAPSGTGIRTDTTDYVGVEGPWAKGEKRAMVQVDLITPNTILRAPIRVSAIGTALSLLTSTSGNANGLTVTTNAANFTPVVNMCSIYARTGANAGSYRVTTDTSTTVAAWANELLSTTNTAGETYVRAPLPTIGLAYAQIGDGTVASFVDGAASPATNYFIVHVLRLDLSVAGEEFVEFMFDADNFSTARA